jgi:2-polyprenyl-6-hydroxyphenyl methylase/3-demethylubiquinone-9 3-methyltransferase
MRALLALTESLRIAPSRVLEVAAGGGGLAATLASAGCQVTANDLRGDALTRELSAYASGGSVAVESGSLFELSPARLGTFDLVIACEVIEHVAHPDALLAHLSAFLAPGGRLLLTTPNGAHFRNRLPSFREAGDPHALEARQFKPDADGHLFLLHPGELCELAAKAGLLVERLNLWGNPLLTGHAGLRVVASAPLVHVAYAAEWLSQRVPSFVRARLCAQMSVVMRKDA